MRFTPFVLAALLVAPAACSKSEPDAPPVVAATERVRPLDLPLARRTGDSLGANAVGLVIALDGIAVSGPDVVPLTRGALQAAQAEPTSLAPLAAAIPGGTSEVRIRMHSATKVATLLAVVATLRARGVARVGFEVRKDGMGEQTGLLVLSNLSTRAPSVEPVVFEGELARTWDALVELWDDAYVACSNSDGSFDCARVTEKVALGGEGELSIFRRQNGIILQIRRFGTGNDVPEAEHFMEQQNDRRSGERNRDEDREAAPPATRGAWGFRWQSLAEEPESPLAKVMKEAARGGTVALRLTLDDNADAGAALSILGAAFPDGVQPPAVVLDATPR